MRKGLLSSTVSILGITGIGVALWTGITFSQESTVPSPARPNTDGVATTDANRPGLVRRPLFGFFKRSQPAPVVVVKDQPAAPVAANKLAAPVAVKANAAAPVAAVTNRSTLPPIPEVRMPTAPPTATKGNSIALASGGTTLPNIPDAPGMKYAKLLEECGHDKNYTWITGVLVRKPGLPNAWFIQYMPADAVLDLHKGCVNVQTNVNMGEYREGEMVTVIGYVITNVEVAPNQRVTGFAAEQVNKVTK